MGGFMNSLDSKLADFIKEQKVFWVATAPLSANGHVNVSPRGYECFNIVTPNSCYWIDMTGSGSETIAHLNEKGNGRITALFNAFEGPPQIVRLYGRGKVFERGTAEFDKLLPVTDERLLPGTRCIIWIDFNVVGYSCGYSVPLMEYIKDRDVLKDWTAGKIKADEDGKSQNGLEAYWALKNFESVDGMPALKRGIAFAESGVVNYTDKDRVPLRIQKMPIAVPKSAVVSKITNILPGFLLGIFFSLVWRQFAAF